MEYSKNNMQNFAVVSGGDNNMDSKYKIWQNEWSNYITLTAGSINEVLETFTLQ